MSELRQRKSKTETENNKNPEKTENMLGPQELCESAI